MSNILKFLIVFGLGIALVLVFIVLRSPNTMVIATSTPIVCFIVLYFWTNQGKPRK